MLKAVRDSPEVPALLCRMETVLPLTGTWSGIHVLPGRGKTTTVMLPLREFPAVTGLPAGPDATRQTKDQVFRTVNRSSTCAI